VLKREQQELRQQLQRRGDRGRSGTERDKQVKREKKRSGREKERRQELGMERERTSNRRAEAAPVAAEELAAPALRVAEAEGFPPTGPGAWVAVA